MSFTDAPVDWIVPDWPAPPGVRAISTTRPGGISSGRYAALNLGAHVGDAAGAVDENRRRLRVALRLPAEPAWLAQVHGIQVARLDATTTDIPTADAAVSHETGRICAILTADCLPVLLADDAGCAIGAAHAGWRGLAAGVIEATVRAMDRAPERLLAWLGPAIGPRHFEVGAEVRQAFLAQNPAAEAAFRLNERGRFLADLFVLARQRLAAAGITRIHGGGLCTHEDPARFFSHRRDGVTGRQATLIWLETC
jgi:YfiH family protein